jgi:hypothetical protein
MSNSGSKRLRMISGFQHEVDENCVLLGYYTGYSGNSLPTFPDDLSVTSSSVENKKVVNCGFGRKC